LQQARHRAAASINWGIRRRCGDPTVTKAPSGLEIPQITGTRWGWFFDIVDARGGTPAVRGDRQQARTEWWSTPIHDHADRDSRSRRGD